MTCERGVRLSGSQLEPPYGELAAMASFHGAPNALVETLVGPYHVRASIRGRTLAVRSYASLRPGKVLRSVRHQNGCHSC